MPFTNTTKLVEVVIATDTSLDASNQDVLSGKKFIGKNKIPNTGSIPINDKRNNIQISSGESITVPYGYNPSDYVINSKKLLEETPATAVSKDVLDSKTCWVNGVEIIGTMPNNNAQKMLVDCDEVYTIPEGYHNGEGTVTGNSLSSQTVATATSDDIIDGKTAYVNGEELTGTMPNNGHIDTTILPSETATITKGYHDGTGTISVDSTATALPEELVNGKTAWVNGEQITGSLPVIANVNGKVMTGDITISGVDAYINKYFTGNHVLDYDGNYISNIHVTTQNIVFYIFQDDWHNNNTENLYFCYITNQSAHEYCTGVVKYDPISNKMNTSVWTSSNPFTTITITGAYNYEKNCQEIKMDFGKISDVNFRIYMSNILSSRKYV